MWSAEVLSLASLLGALTLEPIQPDLPCTRELATQVSIDGTSIRFAGKTVKYLSKKAARPVGEGESFSLEFDDPRCLPGGKGIALFHVRLGWESRDVNAVFYDPRGNVLGQFRSLGRNYGDDFPEFSPGGEVLVANDSDPYTDAQNEPSKIWVGDIHGRVLSRVPDFARQMSDRFRLTYRSYVLHRDYLKAGQRQAPYVFAPDSQSFAFAVEGGADDPLPNRRALLVVAWSIDGKPLRVRELPRGSTVDEICEATRELLLTAR